MPNKHEEADVITVNQVVHAARQACNIIHVVCDDTDVFVLLVHFYNALNIASELLMVPSPERNVTNIGATMSKHGDIVQHISPLSRLYMH